MDNQSKIVDRKLYQSINAYQHISHPLAKTFRKENFMKIKVNSRKHNFPTNIHIFYMKVQENFINT